MKTNTRSDSRPITRRRFLCGISASGPLLAAQRAVAQDPVLASRRALAGGKPLIGTSVQTQFDSVTPDNCMKWQYLCPKEGFSAGEKMRVRLLKRLQSGLPVPAGLPSQQWTQLCWDEPNQPSSTSVRCDQQRLG